MLTASRFPVSLASMTSVSASGESPCWIGADELIGKLPDLVVFAGGYGSGKTEVAVNFALAQAKTGRALSVADLDVVNLYFRSREVRQYLRERGVNVIVPDERLIYADLPVIQADVRGAVEKPPHQVVIDLGGDPVGARVMRSIAARLTPGTYAAFFVLNSRRPFTDTLSGVQKMMDAIEQAGGFRFTHFAVNSHLVDETTSEIVAEGIVLAEAAAAATGVPVGFVAVPDWLVKDGESAGWRYPVLVLERRMLKPWEPSNWLGRRRLDS